MSVVDVEENPIIEHVHAVHLKLHSIGKSKSEKTNCATFFIVADFPLSMKMQFLTFLLFIYLQNSNLGKMMAERIRTISVGDCDSDIGISDVFSSSIHSEPSLMNTSQISASSQDSQRGNLSKSPHNLPSKRVSRAMPMTHFPYK